MSWLIETIGQLLRILTLLLIIAAVIEGAKWIKRRWL